MGFSNMMMAAAKSIPKSTMTQSIPSLTYSSCSTTNMWWLKNCWSFSFTKLIEICSNPLYSKISNPAMSSTAQKFAFLRDASIRVALHFSISHLKIRSKIALAIPGEAPRLRLHRVRAGGGRQRRHRQHERGRDVWAAAAVQPGQADEEQGGREPAGVGE